SPTSRRLPGKPPTWQKRLPRPLEPGLASQRLANLPSQKRLLREPLSFVALFTRPASSDCEWATRCGRGGVHFDSARSRPRKKAQAGTCQVGRLRGDNQPMIVYVSTTVATRPTP